MATPQQEYQQAIDEVKELIKKTGSTAIDPINLKNLQQAKDAIKLLSAELRDMTSDLDYINKSFKDTLNEMSKQNVYLNTAKNSLRGVSSIASQILEHKKGESTLDTSQLTKLKQKAKLQFEEMQLAIKAGNLSTIERDALNDSLKARVDFNKELDRTLQVEEKVNKEIGLAGVALKGFANLMSKAGLGDLSKPFADAIDKTKDARRQIAFYNDAIKELENKTNRSQEEEEVLKSHKNQVLELSKQTNKYKNIVSELGKQLTLVNLVDAAIAKIVTEYFNVNKAAVEYTRLTGQNATVTAGLNSSLATSAQVLTLMAELTKQTGLASGAIFSPDDLGRLAEAQNLLGLSAEQAGNLGIRSKLAGKSIEDYEKGIVKSTNTFNKLNNTAVSHGVVMQDVLNTSDDIALSLGNSDKNITKAAASARSLGLSLEKVDQIASSLMDFETSIGYELEAQLLTGKSINLSKAREYALTNNLAGLSEELKKNGASAAEFANMGRIEQEGLAKALGMSRGELAKSIMMQETAKNLTDEQRANAMGVSVEQMKQMDIQQKIETSLAKLAQAFSPLLDGIVTLLNIPFVPQLLAGAVAVKLIAGNLMGAAKGMGSLVKGALDFRKNLNMEGVSKFFTNLKDSFKQGATGMGASSPVSLGKKPSTDPSSMVGGFSKIKSADLLKGAGAILILSTAMFVAAKAFKEFEGVNFEQVMLGVGTIGALAVIAMTLGKATSAIIQGAFAVAILSASLIPLGFALKLAAPGIEAFGKVITATFAGLATLITAVADGFVKILGAVTMENIGPMLLLGPALFGIAAGLSAVSLAGLTALPAIGGLLLLSKAAPALVSLGIGGEKKSAGEAQSTTNNESFAKIEERLAELINVVKQGGDVYMDSNKIGKALVLGSYKSS
jgi:hypothetical protein